MRLIAINGGPRKRWNTATLLKAALEGAEEAGAETELIHLYDVRYTGCISCFVCKQKRDTPVLRCALQDELSPVLDKVMASDALIIGSPIYLGNVTGQTRSFLERLVFMNLSYDHAENPFKGHISAAFFFTMNVPADVAKKIYTPMFESNVQLLGRLGGSTEYLTSCDTYQFDDYSKYAAGRFDESHKAKVRAEQFPRDRQRAFEIGKKLVLREDASVLKAASAV
ncbi:MAG: flavodoxin family protein [Treponema sp.]|jgi:multimeric flavodoxin WrbA|nr:flavodoxin family protein [Treponema sp.]